MMQQREIELVVVGGGPAGLAAALAAHEQGVKDIVIIERDIEPGGILQQCIHNGFGLHHFNEELTGPEYAWRFIDQVSATEIKIKTNTMVLEITDHNKVYTVSKEEGMVCYQAGAVILAMGCRERTREAIRIPGTRPAGVFTAGTAQRYINMEGLMPGKKVLILGSGDIGLIMARRMRLEGAEVLGVLEIMPYSNGLTRNIVQCLDDFDIPLRLNHTVIQVHGRERLEGVTIAQVDEKLKPILGTEEYIEVDTLLLSVGLIPENELSRSVGIELDRTTGGPVVNQFRETSQPGVFACGNVLHVHDLVDYVTEEAYLAGHGAARHVQNKLKIREEIDVDTGDNVRYTVPQKITLPLLEKTSFYLRVTRPIKRGEIQVRQGDELLISKRERFLKPAEMLKVSLDPNKLEMRNSSDPIVISIEEV